MDPIALYTEQLEAVKATLKELGIPWGPLFFYLMICAAVPLNLPLRYLRGEVVRHVYSALSGLLVMYLSYGAGSANLAVTAAYAYAILLLAPRRRVGLLVAAASFGHLVYLCAAACFSFF